ncbi:MAG TPA: VCBS repeat-containing protein, partial [Blastocatellia bacterium]
MNKRILLAACLIVIACVSLLTLTFVSANSRRSQQRGVDSSTDTRRVVVHATGRGNPYINFEDGVELPASYTGTPEMQSLLKQNATEPRALASADFDEDGVPDLVCGYSREGGGIITLYLGNVDSIFPNSPEAQQRKAEGTFTDSAFLTPARVFEVPIAADFVGAGDFDADGHWDVVLAARGGRELWMLPGDGKGSFLAARAIALPGAVLSLITGEINRADGLTDVVVGILADDGPKVVVFEGPEGALKAKPEIFSLPGEPKALALG